MHPTIRCVLALLLVLVSGACGGSDVCEPDNLNHRYATDASDIELILDHDCDADTVAGILYDSDSFRYDLTGSVQGDSFTLAATRALPSGQGTDTYTANLEILNNGITLRGVVFKNGVSNGDAVTFTAQAD